MILSFLAIEDWFNEKYLHITEQGAEVRSARKPLRKVLTFFEPYLLYAIYREMNCLAAIRIYAQFSTNYFAD